MAYQSLYRRYRSQTFAEVLGQEHVTKALRNAVREGRVTQGYLFSGPRGTGKTSSARILAKVLNCENPADGEPCTECDNCVAVQEGRPVDWLQELDAASNNGVDAIRDLLGRVSMGTSGNRKVYILDEVHMLSKPASNALLKTLEEPPAHVVFVLATTEPEKVLPTIRSRTQHYDFNLLPAEVLADHVRHVIADAGLALGDDAVEHVVRVGGGSARDTLSALDQVAAAGEVSHSGIPVDEIIDAVGARDTGAALLAVDAAVRSGRDPRVVADAVVSALRDAFLVAMGAPGRGLSDRAAARAAAVAEALGPATLTRGLEAVGTALVDMRQAPDPRIPLEVALVRLTRPAAADPEALVSRIEALERGLASGASPTDSDAATTAPAATTPTAAAPPGDSEAGAHAAPAPSTAAPGGSTGRPRGADAARARLSEHAPAAPEAPAPASAPDIASRPSLGGVQRARHGSPPPVHPAPAETAPAETAADPAPEVAPEPATASAPPPTPAPEGLPPVTELSAAWDHVLEALKPRAKALYKLGHFIDAAGGRAAVLALPNQAHLDHCAEKIDEVSEALAAHFGRAVPLTLVVEGGPSGGAPSSSSSSSSASGPAADPSDGADPADDAVDLDELTDAPDASTGSIAQLQDAFPGAELLEEP